MKSQKYILHSVAVLAVAALATACSSEDELTDKTSGNKGTVTITAYQPNTRVGFDSAGNGYWQAGDEIGVWSNGESKFSSFTIASEAGEASATFSGTVTGGIGQYAVYPYNENHNLSGSSLIYYLPEKYTYTSVDQTFLPSEKNGNSFCMPMYGIVSDDNTVSFKHLGGVICLKIDKMPAENGTVKVIETTNKLCGFFTANLTDDVPKIKTAQSESNNAVTFVYSGATKDAVGVFYLPVATGSYNLTIEVSGNKQFSTTTSGTVEVACAHLKVVKVTTNYTTSTPESDGSKTINGHKFIDLGLPSGLLWAETNIGAETEADGGDYFAWGETTAKFSYSIDNNVHYDTSSGSFKKYNSADGKTVLEAADDAAYVNWGSFCRMPTYSEFDELNNEENCTWTWVECTNSEDETIYCYKVVSNKNNNFILLPASGHYDVITLHSPGSVGLYWSSTLCTYYSYVTAAFSCNITSSVHSEFGIYNRYYGFPVRPVAEP